MPRSREAAHVAADLGADDLGAEHADAGNGGQERDRGAKGLDIGVDLSPRRWRRSAADASPIDQPKGAQSCRRACRGADKHRYMEGRPQFLALGRKYRTE